MYINFPSWNYNMNSPSKVNLDLISICNSIMSDDEPPPLEDMSEYLAARGVTVKTESKPVPAAPMVQPISEESKKPEKFAPGIKKGFFNQPPKSSTKSIKTPAKSEPEVIEIKKPSNPPQSPLVLKEVQQAMNYTTQNTTEWLTPVLLQRLAEHPFLAQGLSNPRIMAAVTELQKDPSLASTKYKSDQEVQVFFTEFSKIMADHFGRLAETKQKTFQDDPEVKSILEDEQVVKLLKAMQKGKPIDFHA